jgi:hypothetical protein
MIRKQDPSQSHPYQSQQHAAAPKAGPMLRPAHQGQDPTREDAKLPDPRLSEAQARRWSPLVSVPGFNAQGGDLERLRACGMQTGIVNGVLCIRSADLGRAKELLSSNKEGA